MGIKTVAESVESADILAALLLVGVDFAQGYHINRPVPIMDISYRPQQDTDTESLPGHSTVMSTPSNMRIGTELKGGPF